MSNKGTAQFFRSCRCSGVKHEYNTYLQECRVVRYSAIAGCRCSSCCFHKNVKNALRRVCLFATYSMLQWTATRLHFVQHRNTYRYVAIWSLAPNAQPDISSLYVGSPPLGSRVTFAPPTTRAVSLCRDGPGGRWSRTPRRRGVVYRGIAFTCPSPEASPGRPVRDALRAVRAADTQPYAHCALCL